MSKSKGKRVKSVSAGFEDDGFFSLLEPSFEENSMQRTRRVGGAKIESSKASSAIASPEERKDHSIIRPLLRSEFLTKKNALILERAQVLTKENRKLKKELEKKCLDPKELFKTHAVKLTKESYIKSKSFSTSPDSQIDVLEQVSAMKKILSWIFEQKDELPIRSIKAPLNQVFAMIKTIQVEIEAKSQIIISTYKNKIALLEQKLTDSINDFNKKEKETIDLLVLKNMKLSTSVYELETKIKEQTVIVI